MKIWKYARGFLKTYLPGSIKMASCPLKTNLELDIFSLWFVTFTVRSGFSNSERSALTEITSHSAPGGSLLANEHFTDTILELHPPIAGLHPDLTEGTAVPF